MTVAVRYTALDFAVLESDLRSIPEHMHKMLAERHLRPAGEKTVAAVRRHASWSTRIPGAVHLQVTFAGKSPGLLISVDRRAAPHARPYEGILGGGAFRHPVFGDTDTWVTSRTRPFVWPGVEETQDEVMDAVDAAVQDALTAAGF